jgi:triphosphoribosyl-dephospho-CoA synthase
MRSMMAGEVSAFLGQTACIWEATARKAGNVHPAASFADTEYMDFLLGAAIVRHSLTGLGRFAQTIETVVRETRELTSNTNLGILLLLAPLASAYGSGTTPDDRARLASNVLGKTTILDTCLVYEAIRVANPGGLGEVPQQDVREKPTITLREAMTLAADRDLIARQYANGFADVFDFGVPAFLDGFQQFGCVEAAIVESQLRWLTEYPDSLIARKNGAAVAEDVRSRAAEVLRLGGIATPEGRRAGVALDRHLRSDGNKLNPGTTADLITACLFVALRENKVVPSAPFRWQVTDWL